MSHTPCILEAMQILELFAHKHTQVNGKSPDFHDATRKALTDQLEVLFALEPAPHEGHVDYLDRAARTERALFRSIYSHIVSTQRRLGLPRVNAQEVQAEFDSLKNYLFDTPPRLSEETWLIAGKDQTQLFAKLLKALGPRAALVKAYFDDYPTATDRFLTTYWPNFNDLVFSEQQDALNETARYFNSLIELISDALDPRREDVEFDYGNTAAIVLEKALSTFPSLLLLQPPILTKAFASESCGKKFVAACRQEGDSDLIFFLHDVIGLTPSEIQKGFCKPLSPDISALLQKKEEETSERQKIEGEYTQTRHDLTLAASRIRDQKKGELDTFHTTLLGILQDHLAKKDSNRREPILQRIVAILNGARTGMTLATSKQSLFGSASVSDACLKRGIDQLEDVYKKLWKTASARPSNSNMIELRDRIGTLLEIHRPTVTESHSCCVVC